MSSIFPVLDENLASYVAGVWQGYSDAIQQALTGPWDTLRAIGDNWQGRRADLFNQWWGPASMDINTLVAAAQAMSDGFNAFAARVPEINEKIVQATTLVTANTQPGLPGHYDFTSSDPGYEDATLFGMIDGFDVSGPLGPGEPPTPTWLTQLHSLLRSIDEDYLRAAQALLAAIAPVPGMLKQLTQLKEISRSSGAIGSSGPFASLNDPTWKLLTGGDVFRPTLPPGFRGDPFSGADIPGWYRPSFVQQVGHWVSGHASDIVDATSLLLALSGNPELSAILEITYGGVKDGKALADGDWSEAGLDTFDLVVSVAGMGVGGAAAAHAAEDVSLGHGFSEAVQSALLDSDHSVPPTVAEHFGAYVQGKVEDYIRQQITDAVDAGRPPPTKVTVPSSVLNEIMDQAANDLGRTTAFNAAGLPSGG